MKRFIASMIVGFTFLAMGATMLFFEIKDFEVDTSCSFYNDSRDTEVFNVAKKDLTLVYYDTYNAYDFVYDETIGDEVHVEINTSVDYQVNHNQLRINGYQGSDIDGDQPFKVFNKIVEGLKKMKLYQCNSEEITIRVSKANRSKVHIEYNGE